jgi:cytochrome c-type biogenesis protein CcmF
MASTWDLEIDGELKEGGTIKLENYTAQLKTLELKKKHNYVAAIADLYVEKSGNEIGHLKPEQRFYTVEKSQTSESAIYSIFSEDFYISMSEFSPSNNSILVRLFIRPFMSLIWIGAAILIFGGLYSLFFVSRRKI